MNEVQEQHLCNINGEFSVALRDKYTRGQKEHGGNLWERPKVMNELYKELVDAVTYLHCARENVRDIRDHVTNARTFLAEGNYYRVESVLDEIYHLTTLCV
jgi:hypothetical protein